MVSKRKSTKGQWHGQQATVMRSPETSLRALHKPQSFFLMICQGTPSYLTRPQILVSLGRSQQWEAWNAVISRLKSEQGSQAVSESRKKPSQNSTERQSQRQRDREHHYRNNDMEESILLTSNGVSQYVARSKTACRLLPQGDVWRVGPSLLQCRNNCMPLWSSLAGCALILRM